MWVYEHKKWPKFTWDKDSITFKLANLRYQQGLLIGQMQNLGFELKQEATLENLTTDIIKSSAIEGESLNSEDVRSSVARHLGVDLGGLTPSNRDVEGIVAIMLDATQNYLKPLTKERLFNWHTALFPTGRSGLSFISVGKWRTLSSGPMQVVSGPIGKKTVHFEAPSAEKLDSEMQKFLTWFEKEQNLDPILKSAIAHFWFVTIHPFEDGNGRIGRAIADLALARADNSKFRFYSMSSQIETERKEYYNQLERQQKDSPSLTTWLTWYLDCLNRAITNAEKILDSVLFKAKLWQKINQQTEFLPINDRQRKIINLMLGRDFIGYMNTGKYAKLAKCSKDTALRDLNDLLTRQVLTKNISGGRSTSYRLNKL